MTRRIGLVLTLGVAGALLLGVLASIGAAGPGKSGDLKSKRLSSYLEVPSLSTTGKGTIEVRIRNSSALDYKLTYSGLEGTVTQAHIHLAQPGVSGGISAWLCETATNPSPSASTPTCPASGTVSGTITSLEVIGPTGQGIAAGQFAELVAAMKAGFTYANVHTSLFGGGEVRGQIKAGGGGDDDD
jgi:hypothetical protein